MNKHQALKHLKAVTQAFGPHQGVSFDQKAWDKMHNALEVVLAQHVDASNTSQKRVDENAKQRQEQEPYGQVTVVRRPGCADQHWFYRWPDLPYLDNAVECHEVYIKPPQRKPLTDEMTKQMRKSCDNYEMRGAFVDGWTSAEAAHGIKE